MIQIGTREGLIVPSLFMSASAAIADSLLRRAWPTGSACRSHDTAQRFRDESS